MTKSNMTKAALLPTPGDPYVLKMWFKFFENVWQNEVDKLYIHLNSPVEAKIFDFMVDFLSKNPKVVVSTAFKAEDHGPSLVKLLNLCHEDLILLIEDDSIIFRHGIVTNCFNKIESGKFDIVGSQRGSASHNLIDMARVKYDLDYSGYGDRGPHFWPNFFFCKREDLLKTDLHFEGKRWEKGDYIPQLNLIVDDNDTLGDTFVWTSIQLRAMKLKIGYINQYHACTNDIGQYARKEWLWDGSCPWFHFGSLSSGIMGILRNEKGKPLAFRTNPNVPENEKLPDYIHSEEDKLEFERRCMWWQLCYEETKNECKDIEEFGEPYKNAIERIINEYQLDRNRIEKRKEIYKELLGI